jgi:hypothetical protein
MSSQLADAQKRSGISLILAKLKYREALDLLILTAKIMDAIFVQFQKLPPLDCAKS